jgi:hypothetical protein
MKNILIILVFSVFPITAIIFHLWTTYIAFSEGGFLSGIFTMCFPVIGEIYWMIKMWGENDTYTTIAIIHLIGAFFYAILFGNKN